MLHRCDVRYGQRWRVGNRTNEARKRHENHGDCGSPWVAALGPKPVKVLLRSIDVVHSFYVPEFRTKMDLVPGMVSYVWFTPTRTGTFEILCTELCGNGHFNMRGKVVVQEESEYQAWLQKQKTFAQLSAGARQAKATP